MKVLEPKVEKAENSDFYRDYEDNYFHDAIYEIEEYRSIKIVDTTLDGCIFKNINFSNIELKDVELIDCIFDGCDLSNQKFDFKLIQRVKFINCRMLGISFLNSSLKDVEIRDSKANYINFSESTLKGIIIADTDMEEMTLIELN